MSIFTFKPTSAGTPDPLSGFRAMCREMGPRSPKPEISTIPAVGAVSRPDALRKSDRQFLTRSIFACHALGLTVAENFEYTPLNYGRGEDQDFINPALGFSADMVTINLINRFASPKEGVNPDVPMTYANLGSPYNRTLGAWRNAVEKTEPLVVIAFGDSEYDITTRDILPSSLYEGVYESPKAGRYDGIQIAVHKDMANKVTTQNIANLSL